MGKEGSARPVSPGVRELRALHRHHFFTIRKIEYEYRFAEYEYDMTRADFPSLTTEIHVEPSFDGIRLYGNRVHHLRGGAGGQSPGTAARDHAADDSPQRGPDHYRDLADPVFRHRGRRRTDCTALMAARRRQAEKGPLRHLVRIRKKSAPSGRRSFPACARMRSSRNWRNTSRPFLIFPWKRPTTAWRRSSSTLVVRKGFRAPTRTS